MSTAQHAIVDLPRNSAAYIFGTATAGLTQEVKIKLQTTDGSNIQESTFKACNVPLVVTEGEGFSGQNAIMFSPDKYKRRQIEIIFKVIKNGTPANIQGYHRHEDTPTGCPWVTNYTYSTEDGGDSDYHDTALVVSVIGATK